MQLNRLELALMARTPEHRGLLVMVQRNSGSPMSPFHLMCAAYWTEHPLDKTQAVVLVTATNRDHKCYFCDLSITTDPMGYWGNKSWPTT